MPVVMIEGVDGAGKSTLAEMLVEYAKTRGYADAQLLHYGVPSYDPKSPCTIGQQAIDQLFEPLLSLDADFFEAFIVLDRFHWGEPAYAPVFRPERCVHEVLGTLREQEFLHAQRWLDNVGAEQIYMYAEDSVVMRRLGLRGEEALLSEDESQKLDQVRAIRANYARLRTWMADPDNVYRVRRSFHLPWQSVTSESLEESRQIARIFFERAVTSADMTYRRLRSYEPEPDEIRRRTTPGLFREMKI